MTTRLKKTEQLTIQKIYACNKIYKALVTEFQFNNSCFKLVNIYNKPRTPLESLLAFMSSIFLLTRQHEQIIIVWDFNIDMLQNNISTNKLESFMKTNGFKLHTTKTTTDNGFKKQTLKFRHKIWFQIIKKELKV